MPANKSASLRYRIIDRCLRNKYKPFPSIEDICRQCEDSLGRVSRSTIEKDINAMKFDEVLGINAPIAFSKKEKGYYYTEPGFSIEGIPLNDDEVNSIRVAAQTLYQFRNTPYLSDFYSAIDKIFSKVEIHNRVDDKHEHKYIQFEFEPLTMDAANLPALLRAVTECKTITFNYHKFNGNISKSNDIQPLILKEYRNRWYLAAFHPGIKDVLVYGVERMKDISVNDDTFVRPSEFNADNFFRNSLGITVIKNSEPQEIILAFHSSQSEYLKTKPIHSSQKIVSETAEEIKISLYLQQTWELEMLIMSYGEFVKVEQPESLVNSITKRIENALKSYELKNSY